MIIAIFSTEHYLLARDIVSPTQGDGDASYYTGLIFEANDLSRQWLFSYKFHSNYIILSSQPVFDLWNKTAVPTMFFFWSRRLQEYRQLIHKALGLRIIIAVNVLLLFFRCSSSVTLWLLKDIFHLYICLIEGICR